MRPCCVLADAAALGDRVLTQTNQREATKTYVAQTLIFSRLRIDRRSGLSGLLRGTRRRFAASGRLRYRRAVDSGPFVSLCPLRNTAAPALHLQPYHRGARGLGRL